MTDALALTDFVTAFEADIARHVDHLHHDPDALPRLRCAAREGDAEAVARIMDDIHARIWRERCWVIESLSFRPRHKARQERFRKLAWQWPGNALSRSVLPSQSAAGHRP